MLARGDNQTARSEGRGVGGGGVGGGGGGGAAGGGGGGGGGGGNVRGGSLSSGAPYKVPKLRLEIDPQHFHLLDEMQLRDAWRVAAMRLPSTNTTTTTTTSTAAAATTTTTFSTEAQI